MPSSGVESSFDACGGEIRGKWRYTQVCLTSDGPNPFEGACDKADISATEEWEGTAKFDVETVTFKYDTRERVYFASLPNKCLSEVLTCALVEDIWQPTPSWTPSCLEGAEGCDCIVTVARSDLKEIFEYKQDGDTLEIKKADIEIEYCVQGHYLTIKQTEKQGETAEDVEIYARLVRVEDE